jgi:hypothetical protein
VPNIIPGRKASVVANAISFLRKSELDIVLDGETAFVHSYSTYDEIKGRVDIKFDRDTAFDNLNITFEGQSNTYVEMVASATPTSGRTTGKHTFLKIQQPIDESLIPEDGIFLQGIRYSIPFTFIVPDRLLPYVCSHKIDNEETRKQHLLLPPSLGDPNISGDGRVLMDDLAPEMSKIIYSIRARVTKWNATGRLLDLADRSERIRITPAREEAPPVHIDAGSDYVMRSEKSVRKGLLKIARMGRLTAETSQPRSLRIPYAKTRSTEPVASIATVNLRFDPLTTDEQPPQLESVVSKLKCYTFFGAGPYKIIPEKQRADIWSTLYSMYPETVPLSSRCLSTVSWIRHDGSERASFSSSDLSRRPSAWSTSSTSSIPEPSAQYRPGAPFYTASIVVPFALPSTSTGTRPKVFVPTFHSCIISRTYCLELNISYRSPGASIAGSHVVLKTPIQICADGGERPTSFQDSDAVILAEIEAQFPSSMYESREDHLQRQLDLGLESPGYEEVVTTTTNTPLGGTRHLSLAMPTRQSGHVHFTSPFPSNSINVTAAPPEYQVGSGFRTSYSGRDRFDGSRTQQSVSLSANA